MAAQAMKTNTDKPEREREISLLWLTAKNLVEINSKLTDLLTLQQQEVDLLRRKGSERGAR